MSSNVKIGITTKTTNLNSPDPRLVALKEYDAINLSQVNTEGRSLVIDKKLDSYSQIARNYDDKLHILDRPHQASALEWIGSLSLDLVVSLRYQRILRPEFNLAANCPIINLHSGILPDYRGVMPTFRAMLNGEKMIGTTSHLISDSTIDTGDIISITKMPTNYNKTYYENTLALYPPSCTQLAKTVKNFYTNKHLNYSKQNNNHQYFSHPGKQSLDIFEQSHKLF